MKRITFIGTGYVGLVSGAGISDFGHHVICTDIDKPKIEALQKGQLPIYEPGLKALVARNVKAGRLSFSADVEASIRKAEVVFIAVGTPQGDGGAADISAVKAVAKTIGENLDGYKVVCTKSTVPIGTGRLVCDIIEKYKPEGVDFDYVSNPEFLREGAAVMDFTRPDRIVIGADSERAFEVMRDVYRPLYINETPMLHTGISTAEMIKYACNAFLALKISYINEIANLCESVGADVHMVAKAMGIDGRISPKFLHPGPGFGGSCFPKDTRALVKMGDREGIPIRTVKAAIETNNEQKHRMVLKLKTLLDGELKGKQIAILGLSFKPLTDDVRESPANEMIAVLTKEGARVRAYDPAANATMSKIFPQVEYYDSWEEAASGTDAAVIMTEWNEFRSMDLQTLKERMKTPVILDTRNVLSMEELREAGFRFDNVGRKKGTYN
ncbi:MAG: UDP-glucose/GDP-mannose dehydrogenase family protein [FCB group bacterium]|nr:UDP-glucose/GDP-mannose dehydrogenase family protein [FCB group bacterium]